MDSILRIDNLTFSFSNRRIIDIAEIEFPGDTITAITGPNGSGKTTLLKLAAGLYRPETGVFYLDGTLIKGEIQNILKKECVLVHQTPYIFSGSVRKNISIGLKNTGMHRSEQERKLEELLKAFGLDRYRTKKASSLSGGEKQKVALARGSGSDKRILLLDEPLAHIDTGSSIIIERMLNKLASEGRHIIFTTHDHDFAGRMAGNIIHLENGKITRRK